MDGQCKMWTWDLREKGLSGEETHNKAISGGKLSDTVHQNRIFISEFQNRAEDLLFKAAFL